MRWSWSAEQALLQRNEVLSLDMSLPCQHLDQVSRYRMRVFDPKHLGLTPGRLQPSIPHPGSSSCRRDLPVRVTPTSPWGKTKPEFPYIAVLGRCLHSTVSPKCHMVVETGRYWPPTIPHRPSGDSGKVYYISSHHWMSAVASLGRVHILE